MTATSTVTVTAMAITTMDQGTAIPTGTRITTENIKGTITTMMFTEAQAQRRSLMRLMAWLSPAFPTGSFSYSHGLESAVDAGLIATRDDLADWLSDLVARGSGWNDMVFVAEAWRSCADTGQIDELGELAEALAGSAERHLETMAQGAAFLDAAGARASIIADDRDTLPTELAYPVAVGLVAGREGVPLADTLTAFAHAFVSNLIQAALRLAPIGQRDGVRVLASLEPLIAQTAERASAAGLDDLGSCTFRSEIMSLRHETLHSRLFRS